MSLSFEERLAAEVKSRPDCGACEAILALASDEWEQLKSVIPLRGETAGRISIAALGRVLEVSESTCKRHINRAHDVR